MAIAEGVRGLIRRCLPVLVGTLILMAVLTGNGQPSVFHDTQEYYGGANQIFHNLLHRDEIGITRNSNGDVVSKAYATDPKTIAFTSGRIASRPIFYGLLLYPAHKIGTLWLLAAVQAGLAAYLLLTLWRAALPKAPIHNFYALMALLAVGTPLAFFAGFAMPDIFALLSAVAAAISLFYWSDLRPWDRVVVWIALTVSVLFHTSHLMSAPIMLVLGVGLLIIEGVPWATAVRRAAPLAAAVATAVVCILVHNATWAAERGYKSLRPPFLAARVLADGPGRTYLRSSCAEGVPWALCRYKDLPLDDNHPILFSRDPSEGVANVADIQTLEAIDHEELRFVLGAVAHHPVAQILASLKNTALQLSHFEPGGPLTSPYTILNTPSLKRSVLPLLIPNADHCRRSLDCGSRIRARYWFLIDEVVVAIAIGVLAWRLTAPDVLATLLRRRPQLGESERRLLAVVTFLVLAVVVNAAVCGALSAPAPRYQSRVVALVPLAAWLVVAGLGWRRRRAIEAAAN